MSARIVILALLYVVGLALQSRATHLADEQLTAAAAAAAAAALVKSESQNESALAGLVGWSGSAASPPDISFTSQQEDSPVKTESKNESALVGLEGWSGSNASPPGQSFTSQEEDTSAVLLSDIATMVASRSELVEREQGDDEALSESIFETVASAEPWERQKAFINSIRATDPELAVKIEHRLRRMLASGESGASSKPDQEHPEWLRWNSHTILSLTLESGAFVLFFAGVVLHFQNRHFLAALLFFCCFLASAGSYYAQELFLKGHSKVSMTINIFASLFYRSTVTFISITETTSLFMKSLFGVLVFFDILANSVMFIECMFVRNSDIEDPDSHLILPLIWFLNDPILHHTVRNFSTVFTIMFYLEASETEKRLGDDEYKAGLYVAPLYGGATSTVNYTILTAFYVTGFAFFWTSFNNVLLCVEGLGYYEGSWRDKVCNA